MKTYEFEVPGEESPEALLARARGAARGAGITMRGDADAGTFEGTAEGRYHVKDRTVHVEVTKKPALVPWAMVESALKRAFR